MTCYPLNVCECNKFNKDIFHKLCLPGRQITTSYHQASTVDRSIDRWTGPKSPRVSHARRARARNSSSEEMLPARLKGSASMAFSLAPRRREALGIRIGKTRGTLQNLQLHGIKRMVIDDFWEIWFHDMIQIWWWFTLWSFHSLQTGNHLELLYL